jgi:hypothetical protein
VDFSVSKRNNSGVLGLTARTLRKWSTQNLQFLEAKLISGDSILIVLEERI